MKINNSSIVTPIGRVILIDFDLFSLFLPDGNRVLSYKDDASLFLNYKYIKLFSQYFSDFDKCDLKHFYFMDDT